MDVVKDLVGHIALPKMAPARQVFDDTHIADLDAHLAQAFAAAALETRVRPGESVAIGVGSRGVAELPRLVAATVDALKRVGARPYIVPAMGSHGGATAEGQVALLAGLGVSEASAGCPIRSSMDTVEVGRLESGLAVLMDAIAMEADHIAFINRVKPHTSFSAPIESGLAKMLSIGLANHKGAEACHAEGFGAMADNVVEMAKVKIAKAPILFGLATVENAYDKVAVAEVVFPEEMLSREPDLLTLARAKMPKILLDHIDVLVVNEMGKEFSGTGMDPNITGRPGTPYVQSNYTASKLVILDMSEKSAGNATGLGLADVCTEQLFKKIDFRAFYTNHLTSTATTGAKIPMIMATPEMAVQAGLKTANTQSAATARVVRIPNTLHLGHIMISEALIAEAQAHPQIADIGAVAPWSFEMPAHA
ncbi:MAG: lactate racemase domain-containing protein [Pseudomonadota bacterium]